MRFLDRLWLLFVLNLSQIALVCVRVICVSIIATLHSPNIIAQDASVLPDSLPRLIDQSETLHKSNDLVAISRVYPDY